MSSNIVYRFIHKHLYTIIALGIYYIAFFLGTICRQNHLAQMLTDSLAKVFLLGEIALVFLANGSYLDLRAEQQETELRPFINLIYLLFWFIFFMGLLFLIILAGKTIETNEGTEFSKTGLLVSFAVVCCLFIALVFYLKCLIKKFHTHTDNSNIIHNIIRTLCHSSFMVINVYPWVYIILTNKR